MLVKNIDSNKTNLKYFTTVRSIDRKLQKRLIKSLDKSLSEMDAFLWKGNRFCLNSVGIKSVELSLTMCGTSKIRSLNREYRGKDNVTDVLSFSLYESLKKRDINFVGPKLNLGDIFICKDMAVNQADEFNISLEVELIHLFVHGVLHLCGYDHERSKQEHQKMFGIEEKLVRKIMKV